MALNVDFFVKTWFCRSLLWGHFRKSREFLGYGLFKQMSLRFPTKNDGGVGQFVAIFKMKMTGNAGGSLNSYRLGVRSNRPPGQRKETCRVTAPTAARRMRKTSRRVQ